LSFEPDWSRPWFCKEDLRSEAVGEGDKPVAARRAGAPCAEDRRVPPRRRPRPDRAPVAPLKKNRAASRRSGGPERFFGGLLGKDLSAKEELEVIEESDDDRAAAGEKEKPAELPIAPPLREASARERQRQTGQPAEAARCRAGTAGRLETGTGRSRPARRRGKNRRRAPAATRLSRIAPHRPVRSQAAAVAPKAGAPVQTRELDRKPPQPEANVAAAAPAGPVVRHGPGRLISRRLRKPRTEDPRVA